MLVGLCTNGLVSLIWREARAKQEWVGNLRQYRSAAAPPHRSIAVGGEAGMLPRARQPLTRAAFRLGRL